MKAGEQSYFLISYRKMFKEQACEPRVLLNADIFCDLKVIKVEEIGDQSNIDQLKEPNLQKSFHQDYVTSSSNPIEESLSFRFFRTCCYNSHSILFWISIIRY
ncbi:hypothetical protein ACKWTF_008538 [Chironomus riparius]